MGVAQLYCMVLVDRPRLAALEEDGENYGPVNLDLDASCVPHVLVESAESSTCFSKSGNRYIINEDSYHVNDFDVHPK